VELTGIETDASAVEEGDLFLCCAQDDEEAAQQVDTAVSLGANTLLLTDSPAARALAQQPRLADAGVSAVFVPDAPSALVPLADAFYDFPAAGLTSAAVSGPSATSRLAVSHLLRSLLVAGGQRCGLLAPHTYLGSSLGSSKLAERGRLWRAEEEDPCAERPCGAPAFLAPFQGRYVAPPPPTNPLGYTQLLAGLRDLSADAAVLDVPPPLAAAGALGGMRLDVAVFSPPCAVAAAAPPGAYGDPFGPAEERESAEESLGLLSGLDDPGTQRCVVCLDWKEHAARVLAAAEGRATAVTYSCELPAAAPPKAVKAKSKRAVAEEAPEAEAVADVYPLKVELSIWDTAVTLATPMGELRLRSTLLGPSAVGQLACAAAAGVALGLSLAAIQRGLEALPCVPGVLQGVDEGQPFAVVVDGAHTPASLEQLLQSVRECGAQSVITLLGCSEGSSPALRAAMGATAHSLSEVVIVTSDSPGDEPFDSVLADVVAGFDTEVYNSKEVRAKFPPWPFLKDHTAFWGDDFCSDDPWVAMQLQTVAKRFVIADRFHAIRAALGMAFDGCAVVLAGVGARDFIVVRGEPHWFQDACEAKAALKVLVKKPKSLDTTVLPYRIVDWPAEMNNFLAND